MSVFVTDGEHRATLAVVRALGRAGIPVAVGSAAETSLAGSSRYCARQIRYPSPTDAPEGFRSFIREEVSRGPYRVFLPMTDVTVQLAAPLRGSLPPRICLPFPGAEQVAAVQDKRRVLEAARELGLDCPATHMLDEAERIEDVAQRVRYPVVIKPRFSRYRRAAGWAAGAVEYARDAAELREKYARAHAEIPRPLVQEKVEGEGRGVFLLLWDGEVKAAFCHRRLREKPPWGGVSVLSESLPLDEELVGRSAALLRKLGWQGVAMVEYKLDARDARAKLMEVNGRFWGSLQLAIDAGMDFPLLLYRLATGEDVPAQRNYRAGVKSRWLLGDLDHLWIRLRHAQGPNGAPLGGGSRLRACLDFLKLAERGQRYDVMRAEDFGPAWFELKGYVRDALRPRRRPEATRAC